jgi:hypothetical protein
MRLTIFRLATLTMNQPRDVSGLEAIDVSRSISGITVGNSYYVTAHVHRLGWNGKCVFEMRAGSELLVRRTYSFGQDDSCEVFHASGIFESADTDFTFSYYCYGDGDGADEPVEIWAAFDNVALFVYPAPTPSPPSCPSSDKQTYTNEDGSQFIIVCGQDYGDNDITFENGLTYVKTDSISPCIEYCMYQGTQCVGVSWVAEAKNCFLKSKMSRPRYTPNYLVHSAVRVAGPASGPPSSQLIANGDFKSDLSSWSTSQPTNLRKTFVWKDRKA